ncbi:hypothetical protein [Amycolatopsis eburnea]|uniref:Uncharacterized protein n=1 Tax=Amycolatopsis eburnea TaxID=2267691 RepID=A0A3R9EVM3_9PSEU|nr:hypothetical protein [Amycolatopsis eburnea]RSD21980.1 hypothetical protein EIY87_09185 [Amycolatopsis eburnea]
MTEILAVRPWGNGTTIHLYSAGYQPGKKKRHPADAVLCNGFGTTRNRDLVPISEALGWTTAAHRHDDGCGHAPWRWCRPCLGHAAVLAGMADEAAAAIAKHLQTASGAP